MIASITPVGEAGRQQRWTTTAAAYGVGAAIGGTAVGGLLGLASSWLPLGVGPALAILATVAGIGLLADHGWLPLPSWRRQVDERWLTTYRGWVYGLGFGAQLGAAVTTIVTSSSTYVVLAAAALSGSAAAGALIGGTFGLVRAAPVLAAGHVRTPAALRDLFRRFTDWAPPADRATRLVQAAVGGFAGAAAIATVVG